MVRALRKPETHVDVDLLPLVRTVCGLLDIPVYDSPIDSLHWVFMLFLEMKNNEHINPPDQSVGLTGQLNYVSLT